MNSIGENIWNEIPLEDYEFHMNHETVGQLKLLNGLTAQYLEMLKPETAVFLGIAGGNGLEHIDNTITKKVIGIDVNEMYLNVVQKRYTGEIPSLQLLQLDLSKEDSTFFESDFIWAALILEYAGIENVLKFSYNNLKSNGHLIVSIQSNNNLQTISETGIESIKKVSNLFKIIDPDELNEAASRQNFLQLFFEENILPNGKSIKTYLFQKI